MDELVVRGVPQSARGRLTRLMSVMSRSRKDLHAKRLRRGRRAHGRGLFRSIGAVHPGLLSMSERGAVESDASRSATMNLLDERID